MKTRKKQGTGQANSHYACLVPKNGLSTEQDKKIFVDKQKNGQEKSRYSCPQILCKLLPLLTPNLSKTNRSDQMIYWYGPILITAISSTNLLFFLFCFLNWTECFWAQGLLLTRTDEIRTKIKYIQLKNGPFPSTEKKEADFLNWTECFWAQGLLLTLTDEIRTKIKYIQLKNGPVPSTERLDVENENSTNSGHLLRIWYGVETWLNSSFTKISIIQGGRDMKIYFLNTRFDRRTINHQPLRPSHTCLLQRLS